MVVNLSGGLADSAGTYAVGNVSEKTPMINAGIWHSQMDSNGWTAKTVDGQLSAQYEHTVAITKSGPLILTEQ